MRFGQCDEWNAQQIAARKQLYEAGDGVAPKVGTGAYVRASIDFGYHTHWSNNGMPPTHVQRAHARTAEATAGVGAVLASLVPAEAVAPTFHTISLTGWLKLRRYLSPPVERDSEPVNWSWSMRYSWLIWAKRLRSSVSR